MNGQQLINLLLEHEIGVTKRSFNLFDLALDEENALNSPPRIDR